MSPVFIRSVSTLNYIIKPHSGLHFGEIQYRNWLTILIKTPTKRHMNYKASVCQSALTPCCRPLRAVKDVAT